MHNVEIGLPSLILVKNICLITRVNLAASKWHYSS